jgi:hypothetical protein
MKSFLLVASLFIILQNISGKDRNYAVSQIPENLKANADAIVRYHSIEKEISSDSRITTHETFALTIFNKSAQNLGYFYEVYDKLSRVSGYSVKLYNKYGTLIDKSKMNDFTDVKAYDGFSLFDDNRLIYNKSYSSDFPYTIEYSFNRIDKQTLNIGNWFPLINYGIAIENASFSITTDANNPIRYMEQNLPNKVVISSKKDKTQYTWTLKNYEAIKKEPFMPNIDETFPKVRLAINHFDYDGFSGDQSEWTGFGQWIHELIITQNNLSSETKTKIQQLVDSVETKKQKIALLYKYLQDNTRYVSIQLGIGGYQPFDARIVDETKYGDCKGLSNYMKAILKAADIESEYAIIRAGKYAGQIQTDFPSNQFNHAILCVPDKADTIWLECTSQKKPFGFLGSFTENRPCLLITAQGGKMVKTPEYMQQMNTRSSTVQCTIDSLGNFYVTDNSLFKALQYEHVEKFFHMSKKEQKEALYEDIDLPNLTIQNFDFKSINNSIPEACAQLEFTVNKLGSINGNRMIIPINPFNPMDYIPEKIKTRKIPVTLRRNESSMDTTIFNLPANYTIEYIPDPIALETPYGTYQSQIEIKDKQAIYIRKVKWNKGTFPAEEYENIRNYFKDITNAENQKIVLLK